MSNRSLGEHSWTYKTSLHGSTISNNAQAYLLRENHLESTNRFLSHRVDITALLKPRESNILSIEFDSAFLCGRALQKKHPEVRLETSRTHTSSVRVDYL
ncbi:hypothetical protein FOWG_01851 [Fusarium oxysporum f. sp. lycopersici MN25]|nr:hypothetical protein FOWG_01851 [Fusarium oxysporum f. sp. lycopersici MN25]